jgi:hypothetical protein
MTVRSRSIKGEITDKVFPRQHNLLDVKKLQAEELDDIAEIAYTSAALVQAQHDGAPRVPWVDLTFAQKRACRRIVLTIARNPAASPQDLHEAWVIQKRKDGWTYGTKKDDKKKKHPELLPYKFLDKVKRRSDGLMHVIIRYLLQAA